MNIETLLHKEIVSEFQNLKGMELGTEQYVKTVDTLGKLMDRAIEMEKLGLESKEKAELREDEKKDRVIRNTIAIAGIVVPSIITVWGTLKSIEFEKDGTITTIMGRGFINKLLPKK